MRVLHVTEASAGGVARHLGDLLKGMAARGIEVHLVYSSIRADNLMNKIISELREIGVIIQQFPMRRSPHLTDLKALNFLWTYVRKRGPFSLIHAHSSKAGALVRFLKVVKPACRVVYTPHGFITLSPYITQTEKKLYAFIEKFLGLLTDGIILGSQFEAYELDRLGIKVKSKQIITNGVPLLEPDPILRLAVRKHWGVNPEDLVFGFLGRMDFPKAPDVVIYAFARVAEEIPQAKLVMVGEGPLLSEAKKKVEQKGLQSRVIFTGYQEGREAMQGFDVFVLSSAYESVGYVLLEAMSVGMPVLSTPVGIAPEVIEHGYNGFLYPVNDHVSLSLLMKIITYETELRNIMAVRNRHKAKLFSIDKMIEKTISFYNYVINRTRNDEAIIHA